MIETLYIINYFSKQNAYHLNSKLFILHNCTSNPLEGLHSKTTDKWKLLLIVVLLTRYPVDRYR